MGIWMQFVGNKEEHEKEQESSALDKLKDSKRGIVKCRICKEDHWTTMCPYKDTLGPLRESPLVLWTDLKVPRVEQVLMLLLHLLLVAPHREGSTYHLADV